MSEIRPLTGGTAASTLNGKAASLKQFNSMQRLRDQPEFENLSEDEVCSVQLFLVFARFITENATTVKAKDKLLMRDTYIQYVSGFKNLALARFPKNEIWAVEHLWYTKLRSVISAAVSKRQILSGLAVQEKSDAVDRTLLTSIVKSIMKVMYDSKEMIQYEGGESNETTASGTSSSVATVNDSLCKASAKVLALYVMRKGHKAQELFYDWYVLNRLQLTTICL